VLTRVAAELPLFLGPVFEELCRAWVRAHGPEAPWGFLPTRVGAWWDRTAEIDLMAVGEDAVLFGECKWTTRPVGTNILDDLKRQAYPLRQQGGWAHVQYLLGARTGFTPALVARAADEGVTLVTPAELLAPEA
jgi:AAA+ ATPase superfamily predicted ATPase